MKKFLCVFLFVCLFASMASAASHRVGIIAKLSLSQEEFQAFAEKRMIAGETKIFSASQQDYPMFIFFDTLNAMQMALDAGNIDEIMLPEEVAEYVMNVSGNYKVACVVRSTPITFNFGFREKDDPAMKNKFNEAIMSMKADGTLSILVDKYISYPGLDEPESVKFEHYDNVDKVIKVAVTGDLPPIDFIKADGTPAGFNTAVLAEIGKRLKINIELVNIDSGARAASLASGRSDVVFWFESYKDLDGTQPDIPEGIALSESYYQWSEFLHITKK